MKGGAFFENIRMSFRSIAANAVRSFLTALGVMIGTGAVIAMLALGAGAQKSVEASLQSLGSNLLLVYSGQLRGGGLVRRSTSNIVPYLSAEDLEAIRNLGPELVELAAISTGGQAKFAALNMPVTIVGTGSVPQIRNVRPMMGIFTEQGADATKPLWSWLRVYGNSSEAQGTGGTKIRLNGLGYRWRGHELKGSSPLTHRSLFPSHLPALYLREPKVRHINVKAPLLSYASGSGSHQQILRLHRLPSLDAADFLWPTSWTAGRPSGSGGTFTLLLGNSV